MAVAVAVAVREWRRVAVAVGCPRSVSLWTVGVGVGVGSPGSHGVDGPSVIRDTGPFMGCAAVAAAEHSAVPGWCGAAAWLCVLRGR